MPSPAKDTAKAPPGHRSGGTILLHHPLQHSGDVARVRFGQIKKRLGLNSGAAPASPATPKVAKRRARNPPAGGKVTKRTKVLDAMDDDNDDILWDDDKKRILGINQKVKVDEDEGKVLKDEDEA
ncbi:hypothetical protein PG987_013296 [Apiospora arundinis]